MATDTQITIAEYLTTSYRPDREFIDGELQQRNVGKRTHARTLALLAGWFGNHECEWSAITLLAERIQVSPTRVRIPDIVLTSLAPQPEVLVDPPLLIVEILSPEDTYFSLEERTRDYQRMGVETVWIIDPRTRTARICQGRSWTEEIRLTVPGTPIFLDLPEILRDLDTAR